MKRKQSFRKTNWKKQTFSFLLFCSFPVLSEAQFQFNFQDSIVVKKAGVPLKMPWSGGLNYAQFSEIDYDFDGDLDLFVFDRSFDQIRIFKQEIENGNHLYKYEPLGHLKFPSDVRYRAALVDYNGDGKNDLFTYGIGGIKVYKNVGNAVSGLLWELVKDLLYSDYEGTLLNLYVSSSDIPALVDVEKDGDLDILTYHIGGERLQYHQNQSMELYGVPDSLVFKLKNECWGGFREDLNSNAVFLNDQTAPCGSGNIAGAQKRAGEEPKAHAGSTVLALDIDGSGVLDLIIGDVAFSNLNLLINGGAAPNTNSLMISDDVNFPSNTTPVNMQVFPAAYLVDTDFDDVKDLVVAPNAKNASENETSCMKYKNTGSNTVSNFVFSTKGFLQEDMLENGTASVPILVDLTNDGLKDLLIANYYSYKPTLSKISRIAYYKNTGTSSQPVFSLVENDFLNLSTTNYGLKMMPTFGDLTGDNKPDLILGLEDGSLVYFKNNSSGSTPSFAAPQMNFADANGNPISAGQNAAPQLFDLDKDGKLDLIVGRKTGELDFYKNVGSNSIPSFSLQQETLGQIDIATTSPDGFPVPHFFRWNDTTYLFLGGYDGKIRFYDEIDNHLTESFNLRADDFLGLSKELGAYSATFVDDIDNDGKLNLFIGQDLGGLYHLEHLEGSNLSVIDNVIHDFTVYPNPFQNEITINSAISTELKLVDLLGQQLCVLQLQIGKNQIELDSLNVGIYLLVDSLGNCTRIVKR